MVSDPYWNDPPVDMDDTLRNRACWQAGCHGVPNLKKTHSSLGLESTRYGEWSWECVTCHDPHMQRQTVYGEYMPSLTGTVTSWDEGTGSIWLSVTLPDRTGNGDAIDDYGGWTIVPNTRYRNINYKIVSNTSNSVTVTTPIDVNRISIGSTFGILPGRYVKDVIFTPGGPKLVKFLQLEGVNSFVHNDGLNGGQDSTPDGVCQVCHGIRPEGASFLRSRADGTGFGDGHETDTSQYCSTCHTHGKGLGVDCTLCHGFPPVDGSTLVFNPGPTGSATAGAHAFHATTRAIPCDDCHKGSAGYGTTHNNGLTVTMGYSLFNGTFLGGSYDGQTTVNYDTLQPGTAVTKTGSKTCSNIYCHGRLPDGTVWGGGTDTSPVWDGPPVVCGACHKATAASYPPGGSHSKHAQQTNAGYGYDCGLCHKDPALDGSLHVNGRSEVIFSSDPKTGGGIYGGTPAALDAYGTCTNIYCHSTVQSSPPGLGPIYRTAPAWGSTTIGICSACHDYSGGSSELSTGSHQAHIQTYPMDQCFPCHNYNNTDDSCFACHDASINPQRDRHADHIIDVAFAPRYGGSYSGSSVPDTSYGDCSNVYCHGTYSGSGLSATPSWGNASTGACGTCHGASNNPDGFPASGNHERHADSDNTINTAVRSFYNRNYACNLCHNGIVDGGAPDNYSILDAASHSNGTVNWSFDISDPRLTASSSYGIATGMQPPTDGTTPRAFGTCTNIYCHSNVQPNGGVGLPDSIDTPQWGGTVNCSLRCHAPEDLTYMHGTTMASGSHAQHMTYSFSVDPVQRCTLCHKWNASASSNDCNQCHTVSEQTFHVNGTVDLMFDPTLVGSSATYYGTPTPGDGYGACSQIYCHSDVQPEGGIGDPTSYASPEWGVPASVTCGSCHNGEYTHGSAVEINTGSHTAHLSYKFLTASDRHRCAICHIMNPSGTFNNCRACHPAGYDPPVETHANHTVEVTFDPYSPFGSIVYNGTPAPGDGYSDCSNSYCHSSGESVATFSVPANTSPDWGTTGPLACNACHGNPPDYGTGSPKANSHLSADHLISCDICHYTTTNDGSSISDKTLHVNRTYNVSPAPGYSFTYSFSTAGGTCTAATCHSGPETRQWGQ